MPKLPAGIVGACCLLSGVGLAATPDPWLRMKSANFELFTTAGERSGRDLIRHFEQVRSFFAQAFKLQGSPLRPAQVIAFRTEKEYEPYRPSEVASAFFHGGQYHDFIVMAGVSADYYPAAVHEYTHLLVHQSNITVPVWLNEGLAELYSNLEAQGSKIIVGKVIPGRAQTLNREKWIPLRELMAVDHSSPMYNEKSRAGMFYSESWLLVHMLQMVPAYASKFAVLSGELTKSDGASAFLTTYGKTIDKVDLDLREYMHSTTMSARLFPIQLPKEVEAPEIEKGAALWARLALAEMLGSSAGHRSNGKTAYEELAADFPGRWEAEAGIARGLVRDREYADAALHFELAEKLGSKDARMYLDYGKLLTYSAKFAEAVKPFRTAVDLDPNLTEAHVELGISLGRTNAFREAIVEFQKVKNVPTSLAPRYLYNFAYACYRLDAMDEARTLIAKARPHTRNAPDIAALDRLEEALARPRGRPAPPQPSDAAVAPATQTESGPPPRLIRRQDAGEAPLQKQQRPVAEGSLENIQCNGVEARLHVVVGGATRIFLIDNPDTVVIRDGAGAPVEMTCGKQTPRTVRIGFDPPSAAGLAGVVRTLDFP